MPSRRALKWLPLRRSGKWDPTGEVRKLTRARTGVYALRETHRPRTYLYVGESHSTKGKRSDYPERFYKTILRHFHGVDSFAKLNEWTSKTTHDLDAAIVVTKPTDAYAVEGQLILQLEPIGNRDRPETAEDGDDSFSFGANAREKNPGRGGKRNPRTRAPSKASDERAVAFREKWTGRPATEFITATPDNPPAHVRPMIRVHSIAYREAKRGRHRKLVHEHKFKRPFPVLCGMPRPGAPRVSSVDVPTPRESRTLVSLGELVAIKGEVIATGEVLSFSTRKEIAFPRGIRIVGDPVTRDALFLRLTPRARATSEPLFLKRAKSPYTLTERGFER